MYAGGDGSVLLWFRACQELLLYEIPLEATTGSVIILLDTGSNNGAGYRCWSDATETLWDGIMMADRSAAACLAVLASAARREDFSFMF